MRPILLVLLLAHPVFGQLPEGANRMTTVDGKVVEINGVQCVPFTLGPRVESPPVPQSPHPVYVVPRSVPYVAPPKPLTLCPT